VLKDKSTRLPYLKTKRAEVLFAALDDRYLSFAGHLPRPLNSLAHRKSTFEGDASRAPFAGIGGLNPVLVATPWLFWEPFQSLSDDDFLGAAEAGMFFVLASVLQDHIIDGQADPVEGTNLFNQALFNRAIRGFQLIFPPDSGFWPHYDRLTRNHIEGLATEITIQETPEVIDLAMFKTMAYGKVSPIVTTIAALSTALGAERFIEPIEASLKHIAVASQMLDDIGDWKEDIKQGHVTYFLAIVSGVEDGFWDGKISHYNIQSRINETWEDVHQIEGVIDWLDRSVDAVGSIDCPQWLEYVNGYRVRADQHARRFIACHMQQALRPLLKNRG